MNISLSEQREQRPRYSFYRPHMRVFAPHSDELVTRQDFKAECDINTILRQYSKTGVITHVQKNRPTYTDLPDGLDYQRSMNIILEGQEAFDGLPSSVRSRFGNDPATFLLALSDPDQRGYLTEVGVFKTPPVSGPPEPVRPPAAPPLPATPPDAA